MTVTFEDLWPVALLDKAGWSVSERRELADLQERLTALPATASRVLLSIRLSILTDETTSPIRQELDLVRMAVERGSRVVGIARDLGVSATKVPPWKRPQLGEWIRNRAPEFDEILFWKLDRFVRRISDLHLMIEWCKEYQKTLAAKNDPIDLSTEFGQFMVTIIAGMARIEAANTGVRIESLWKFSRTVEKRWLIGKPVYGYKTELGEDGTKSLVFDHGKVRALRWVYSMVIRGTSLYKACKLLTRAGILPPNKGQWSQGNLKVILINPALMGYRVYRPEGHKQGKPPLIAYSTEGTPIKITEGIFTKEEFDRMQGILDARSNKEVKQQNQRTPFLGTIKCGNCGRNWYDTAKKWKRANGETMSSSRLRCASYLTGACGMKTLGEPEKIYALLKDTVLEEIGDYEVIHRKYTRGDDSLARKIQLEEQISHYMTALEPGGSYRDGGFIEAKAKETLSSLGRELANIDPESVEDRWTYESQGVTYLQHWETHGVKKMEEDLVRSGITFVIYEDHADLNVPHDIKERLIVRGDFFGAKRI
ncbi:recombinase family protein [Streptomyces sp. NBC_01500]|uniref:recombinase family protein n=1 Tax=Streptomyces sp. NBC_01500 TaxID=2903886 RepID=UPI002258650A|nr:recombinase family protein [Streptomyces sp. NBC_01500]MCX4554099.1 recombinase family protein [Streptomyces sp. NBC_01500]